MRLQPSLFRTATLAAIFLLFSSFLFAQDEMSIQERKLLTRLMMAQKDEIITLEEGVIDLINPIWIEGKEGVQIVGAGAGKTVLNFKGQTSGTESIRIVSCKSVSISGLSIRNAFSDGIRIQNCQKLLLGDIEVEWRDRDQRSMKTGAMGFACFTSQNIRFEGCRANGAVGTGFMLAHSAQVVLKSCVAEGNSAGVVMQNIDSGTISVCTVNDNAIGIGVMNMPGGVKQKSYAIAINGCTITGNNRAVNSAPGDFLSRFPGGTGLICMGAQQAAIHENTFSENNTAAILLLNYATTGLPRTGDEVAPFLLSDVALYDNRYQTNGKEPQAQSAVGKTLQERLNTAIWHDIVYDGVTPNETAPAICIRDQASFANLKMSQLNPVISFDLAPFNCSLPVSPGQ